jgi:hypothetical protein
MDTRKLLVEMLADWDDLADQLDIVTSVLITRLAKRRNVGTEGVLKLLQHHLLLAAIRLPGEFNVLEARLEFEKALKVLEIEREVKRPAPPKLTRVENLTERRAAAPTRKTSPKKPLKKPRPHRAA